MAKAMQSLDVIKILLGGGYVCGKQPPVSGKNEYTVHREYGAQCGHITERQFCQMREKGIIEPTHEPARDKARNFYTFYFLTDGRAVQ